MVEQQETPGFKKKFHSRLQLPQKLLTENICLSSKTCIFEWNFKVHKKFKVNEIETFNNRETKHFAIDYEVNKTQTEPETGLSPSVIEYSPVTLDFP